MKAIFTIRGIAIACVVLGHAIGWVYLIQSWYVRDQSLVAVSRPLLEMEQPTTSPTYQVLHGIKQLTLFDVPAFLFASGFFLSMLSGRESKVSYKAVGEWIKGLLIPFLIWLTINSLVSWLPLALFGDNPPPPLLEEVDSTLRFLYFIPLIFQFYLLSPTILKMAQTDWKKLLLIATVLQLVNTALWYVQKLGIYQSEWLDYLLYYNSFFFVSWALYFPLGCVCGLKFKKFRPFLQQYRTQIIIASVVSGVISLLEMYFISSNNDVIIPTVNSLSSIVYAVSLTWLLLSIADQAIPHQKQWMNFGARSLGIYLSHTVVLVTTARALYHLIPVIVYQPLLLLVILFLLAMTLPYLFSELLYRHSRSTWYQILFG